jgi:ferredoxin-type protein NapH
MKGNWENVAIMLGKEPTKPKSITADAQLIHNQKQNRSKTPAELLQLKQELANVKSGNYSKKWRNRRWLILIIINLLFTGSFWLDIQLFEGSLIASRVLGFHMADPYSALQVALAYRLLFINLIIGTVTVILLWIIFGGRAFCAWVCPYHLLAEWAEQLHLKLVANKWVIEHSVHRGIRPLLFILFILLAFLLGYSLFNSLNPVGIVSRALIYGPSLALLWVLLLLSWEVLYSRRAWCRYVCPMGLTYGLIGTVSPLQVSYHLPTCQHEGACLSVCEVPHVLDCVKKGRARDIEVDIGTDCTLCGACVDICPSHSLTFAIKGLSH